MREIKFRAWSYEFNGMYWFDLMWGNPSYQGSGYLGVVPWGEELQYNARGDNRLLISPIECSLMQYTGLKDKNGVEIYEGDILKYPQDSFGRNYLISWSNSNCGFWFEPIAKLRQFGSNFELRYSTECEVIGNIWENKELINKEG